MTIRDRQGLERFAEDERVTVSDSWKARLELPLPSLSVLVLREA